MKRTKRLVALLVTIATLASLFVFSVPALAEELPRVEVTAEDELRIEKLEALGVIDVKYNAASYVTRRQMAEIIVRYMNLAVTSSEEETPFRDVKTSDTAYVAIRTLYDMGIVSGDYDKRFNPDNYLTYDEALVFIINAIGYKMFAVREGGYPTGYHRVAISHGMLKNLSMKNGSDAVKLPDVYKMLEAALSAASIEEVYYGSGDVTYTFSKTETFLSETYGIRKYRGVISGNEYTRLDNAKATLTDEQIEIDGENGKKVYETPGYFYGYMLGYTVDYYLKDDKGVGDYELKYIEEAGKLNEKIKIDVDDLLKGKTASASDRIYYEDADEDEQHITFAAKRYYIYNNQSDSFTTFADVLPARGYIEALDNNSDGKYDVLFVYEYVSYVVEAVDVYDNIVTVNDGKKDIKINLNDRKEKYAVYLAGTTGLKDINAITAGSVVSIMTSKGVTPVRTIYVSTKTVSGTITTIDSEDGYLIGENYYKSYADKSYKVGTKGLFYIDMNDQIVAYKYDATGDKSVFGIMTAYGKGENRSDPKLSVKIYAKTGEFVVLPLAERVKLDGTPYDLSDKSKVDKAIKWLNDSDDASAEITATYPVKYTDVNGEITSIMKAKPANTPSEPGDGQFKVIKENIVTIYKRHSNIIATWTADEYADSGHYKFMPDFNVYDGSSVLFVVPPDGGDLSDETKYQVRAGGFSEDKTTITADEQKNGVCYNSYSFGTADPHKIDLMVLKSAPAPQPVSEKTLGVIKKITDTVDEDGKPFKKFYINENTELLVEEKVKMVVPVYRAEDWIGTHKIQYQEPADITSVLSNPDSHLGVGSAIIYGLNSDGRIESIRVLAQYKNGKLNTFFRAENSVFKPTSLNGLMFENNKGSETGAGGGGWDNIIAGKIESVGETPGMITCKFLNEENKDDEFLIKTNTSGVYSYYSEANQTIEHLTLGRFAKEDIFIVHVDNYYLLKTIIVFRKQ